MKARLATVPDFDVVQKLVSALLVELGGDELDVAESAQVFQNLVADERIGFVVIGEMEGESLAACTVSVAQALRCHGTYAIVQEMYVVPEQRSSGIGLAVLRFALDHALALGCRLVELGTPVPGDRQIQFYERAGFVQVGARLRWTPMPG